ncbi:MAG: glycerate kinase [Phycisphaerales bacterium]|nr:glycerate kinase [Phycisphaerales bacterium]
MRILVAPDKFKKTLSAAEVALAISAGAREALPDADIDLCPLADGGEGIGEIVSQAARQQTGAQAAWSLENATVLDPLGRPIKSPWRRRGDIALIEMPDAAGYKLLGDDERDPMRASTFGLGELIRAAIDAGCSRVMVGVGGSATVDGGAGALSALGCVFRDAANSQLPPLIDANRIGDIVSMDTPPTLPAVTELLCDVTNPLLGPNGAAPVFAPQKGAKPADIPILERRLAQLADVYAKATGRAVRDRPHSGAAGGFPAGMMAAFGASVRPGFDFVAEAVGLEARIRATDLVITGEGQFDAQTASGKVVTGVMRLAAIHNKPVWIVTGSDARPVVDPVGTAPLQRVFVITPAGTPLKVALRETRANIIRAVRAALVDTSPE